MLSSSRNRRAPLLALHGRTGQVGTARNNETSISVGHFLRASFRVGDNAPNGCDQPIELDRLGVELVAPRRERLFALAGERMRRQRDDRDVAGLRIALEPSG